LNVNAPPVFDPLDNWRIAEGQEVKFTAFALDPDNPNFVLPTRLQGGGLAPLQIPPSVTYTVSGLPLGASVDTATAVFDWVPGFTQAGDYAVTFTATDDGNGTGVPLTSSTLVHISVLNVNRPPVITPTGNVTVARGQTLDVPVTVTDPDGNPITLTA